MATPHEKLAESLEALKALQEAGVIAIKTSVLSRTHKERLVKHGFIKEVLKGWYIATPHEEIIGDTSSWYTSYWDFCSQYLEERYGVDYYISAEQSLFFHSGNTTVPKQLIVKSTKGNNTVIDLLFGTSIFAMKSPVPKAAQVIQMNGVRVLDLPSSIVYSTHTFYNSNAIDMRTALIMIRDSSEVLPTLLTGTHSRIAGRLCGAFRNIGQSRIADDILQTMKTADFDVREEDPFEYKSPIKFERERSPYVTRVKLMWSGMRESVIKHFPKTSTQTKSIEQILKHVDDIYVTDAYHSLSIERYRVTTELIERVKSGEWDAKNNEEDRKQRDAMAARGYWQAFNVVKESLQKALEGQNVGQVADIDHGVWYRELFAPSVTVGLLKLSDLAGYRNHQVYIGGSMYTPMNKDAVRDVMPLLFELIEQEEEASVRAVLGHFIFVFTHPYMDGNGRMGRFLMNVMLVSGGYPWTVIPNEMRDEYMNSLETASVDKDIIPFASFLAKLVTNSMDGKPDAKV